MFEGKTPTITVLDTKNGKNFVQPMSTFVYELLRRRAKKKESKVFVFPSNKSDSGHIENVYDAVEIVKAQSKIDFKPHDIRRTFATYAALLVPSLMVKRLINHTDKRDVTEKHYANIRLNQMCEPVELIAQYFIKHGGEAFADWRPQSTRSEIDNVRQLKKDDAEEAKPKAK